MSDKFMVASFSKDTRLCVIENAIFIEELTSRVLGTILNVDWINSKSFGNGSSALSFNQKMELIQDVRILEKIEIAKITAIAHIRNKFAHVSNVNSFETFFTTSSIGKDVHKQFLNWYYDNDGIAGLSSTRIELSYRLCFYLLVHEAICILLKITDDYHRRRGLEDGKREVSDKFIQALVKKLKEKDLQSIISETIEEITFDHSEQIQ